MRRISAGFTLTEVLITLTIAIILALAAIPLVRPLIQKHRLIEAAENLYSNLQSARTKAISGNSTVYVAFTTGDSWCYGMHSGSACNCATPTGCSLGTAIAAQAGQTSLSTTGSSSNTVNFEPTHGAANTSGSITLTLYGQSTLIKITVSRMGNLQMCATGISGYTVC